MNLIFLSLIITISSWGGANAIWQGFRIGLQWPPGFCQISATNCTDKTSIVNTFIIDSLRFYNDWTPIRDCAGSTFNVSSVSDFRAELGLAWPRKYSWASEWNNYGRCTESISSQTDYFRSSLAFRKAFDILGLLEKEGIHPMDAFYPTTTIIKAIKKNLNKTPELYCRQNSQEEVVLDLIYLCMDNLLSDFVDCPEPTLNCKEHDTKFVSLTSQFEIYLRSNASSNGDVLIK